MFSHDCPPHPPPPITPPSPPFPKQIGVIQVSGESEEGEHHTRHSADHAEVGTHSGAQPLQHPRGYPPPPSPPRRLSLYRALHPKAASLSFRLFGGRGYQ